MYQLGIIGLIRVTARYGPDIIGSLVLLFKHLLKLWVGLIKYNKDSISSNMQSIAHVTSFPIPFSIIPGWTKSGWYIVVLACASSWHRRWHLQLCDPFYPYCFGVLPGLLPDNWGNTGQIDDGGKSTNRFFFLSPFKNAHSAFPFDCIIRKYFSDHAIKWKSTVRVFEKRFVDLPQSSIYPVLPYYYDQECTLVWLFNVSFK